MLANLDVLFLACFTSQREVFLDRNDDTAYTGEVTIRESEVV